MPVSLGVPEILVGNITSGQVVLRDIQYVPTTQIKISDSNGPEPIAITPGGSATNPTINLNTPVMADERLVLFNRSTNSYITTTPILGKEALAQYPNIEFIGSFDSRTANLVAKELAANPPSSISAEIMDARGKTDIGENMQILAVLNAMVTALGTRGQILKELLNSGELVPVPDIQKQWEMAAGINDFSEVSVPDVSEIIVQTSPNPIRTTKAIGEEVPPTNGPGPTITTLALGEETPPGSFVNPFVSGSPRPPWDMNVNPPMQSTMPSNCVKVPPGVPPVPAGCVPVRPPVKPPIRPYVPPSKPPSQPYDDSGKGVGSI